MYKIVIIDDFILFFNYYEEFKIIYLYVYNYKDNVFYLYRKIIFISCVGVFFGNNCFVLYFINYCYIFFLFFY